MTWHTVFADCQQTLWCPGEREDWWHPECHHRSPLSPQAWWAWLIEPMGSCSLLGADSGSPHPIHIPLPSYLHAWPFCPWAPHPIIDLQNPSPPGHCFITGKPSHPKTSVMPHPFQEVLVLLRRGVCSYGPTASQLTPGSLACPHPWPPRWAGTGGGQHITWPPSADSLRQNVKLMSLQACN